MSNYYAPCFYRIDFFVIPSYIELPWTPITKNYSKIKTGFGSAFSSLTLQAFTILYFSYI